MKTLTVTEARANLSSVLDRAKRGEEIGIISGNRIIQLRPVDVVAWEESYLFQEYGVGPEEWDRFQKGMKNRRIREKYQSFEGTFDPKALH